MSTRGSENEPVLGGARSPLASVVETWPSTPRRVRRIARPGAPTLCFKTESTLAASPANRNKRPPDSGSRAARPRAHPEAGADRAELRFRIPVRWSATVSPARRAERSAGSPAPRIRECRARGRASEDANWNEAELRHRVHGPVCSEIPRDDPISNVQRRRAALGPPWIWECRLRLGGAVRRFRP